MTIARLPEAWPRTVDSGDAIHEAVLPRSDRAATDAEAAPERNERLTGQQVGSAFVARYVLAMVGLWLTLMTPASVTLALRIGQLVPQDKAQALALVFALGAASSMVGGPIIGALCDHSTLRWGQRRPFIVGGLSLGGLAMALLGVAPTIAWVVVGWMAAQCLIQAAVVGLFSILPERVPARLRGRTSGLMGMSSQVGVVGGAYLIQWVGTAGLAMFLVPTGVGIAMTLPLVLTLREAPRTREEVGSLTLRKIAASFWINPVEHRDFALAFAGRFFILLSMLQLTNYKTYLLMDRLHYTTASVVPVLTQAVAVLAVANIVGSLATGLLSDLIDRRKIFLVVASLLFVAAMLVVAFADGLPAFFAGIALMGVAWGIYVASNYALVAQTIPDAKGHAGRAMGFFNLSNTIPQTLAPLLSPLLLSVGGGGQGNYTALFIGAAAFAACGALLNQMIRVR